MSYNTYTIYKNDGTKQILYGTYIEDALDNAGFSMDQVIEQICHYRKGFSNELEFIDGKWKPRSTINVNTQLNEFNKN